MRLECAGASAHCVDERSAVQWQERTATGLGDWQRTESDGQRRWRDEFTVVSQTQR